MVEQREVVDTGQHTQHHPEAQKRAPNLSPVLEEMEGQQRPVSEMVLPGDKDGQDDRKHDEQHDDDGGVPGLGVSTPLKRKEERGDETEGEGGSKPVERKPSLKVSLVASFGILEGGVACSEEEENDGDGDGSNGNYSR